MCVCVCVGGGWCSTLSPYGSVLPYLGHEAMNMYTIPPNILYKYPISPCHALCVTGRYYIVGFYGEEFTKQLFNMMKENAHNFVNRGMVHMFVPQVWGRS